jgi:hypothetical protein
MPVVRKFPTQVSVAALLQIVDSLGAHVSAKLELFGTDERTLTDDLCDMLYIWARSRQSRSASRRSPSLPSPLASLQLPVEVSKTTQQEESAVGCDLAITVTSPHGAKTALFQAKVFDPKDDDLRCASKEGWSKLWSQLVLMQQRESQLSHMLVYVPGSRLGRDTFGYSTWEQGFQPGRPNSSRSARYGVTLIRVDDLLDGSGNWLHSPPVEHLGGGAFNPPGTSLSQLLVDMISCKRGTWSSGPIGQATSVDSDAFPIDYRPYREIGLSFAEASPADWERTTTALREWRDDDFDVEGSESEE